MRTPTRRPAASARVRSRGRTPVRSTGTPTRRTPPKPTRTPTRSTGTPTRRTPSAPTRTPTRSTGTPTRRTPSKPTQGSAQSPSKTPLLSPAQVRASLLKQNAQAGIKGITPDQQRYLARINSNSPSASRPTAVATNGPKSPAAVAKQKRKTRQRSMTRYGRPKNV